MKDKDLHRIYSNGLGIQNGQKFESVLWRMKVTVHDISQSSILSP